MLSEILSREFALLQNLGLLAGVALAYSLLRHRLESKRAVWRHLTMGAVFGGAGALSMGISIELGPGIIFDLRGIPLILAGPFAGPWAAMVSAGIIAVARVAIGGAGVPAGLLSLVGLTAVSMGLWWLRPRLPGFGPLWLAFGGLAAMVPVFASLTALGFDRAVAITQDIGLPLSATYTAGCALVGFLLLLEDRRHKAETELNTARLAAEQANNAKSLFLAQISHELRTPMAAITGSLELLSISDLPEEQRSTLTLTRRSANTLLALLDDLLDLSRINAGRLEIEPQPVDIDALLGDVKSLFSGRARKNGVDIALTRDPGLPPAVLLDGKRLRQVVTNLVGNAVKFTSRGFIELAARQGEAADGSRRLILEVRDSGPGIPQARQSAIFEAFEQSDAGTARRFGGTGLGLSISRKLARAMGGDIFVESAVGVGSRFTVDLPLVEADAGSLPIAPGSGGLQKLVAERPLAGRRLLLAEDIDANRTILQGMLTALGAEVIGVPDGAAALDAVKTQADPGFDLVLMDMHMPVMDGSAAVRSIRRLPEPAARTLLVGLTADAMSENRAQYMAAGLDGFLTKPVDWPKLVELVEDLGLAERESGQDTAAWADPAAPGEPGGPANDHDLPPDDATGVSALPVWNPEVQAGLKRALGENQLLELLQAWPASAHVLTEQIAAAARDIAGSASATETVKYAAHALRGAAGNYGFERVAALAGQIQDGAASGPDAPLLARLKTEVDAVERLISRASAVGSDRAIAG